MDVIRWSYVNCFIRIYITVYLCKQHRTSLQREKDALATLTTSLHLYKHGTFKLKILVVS